MDASAMELMKLVLVAVVFSLVKSPCFYEKVSWQLLDRARCMFLLRTQEQLKSVAVTIT